MRHLATAAVAAALSLTLQASAALQAQTTKPATPRRATTGTAAHRKTAGTSAAADAQEGLAAVGTMPAATGPAKPLFTLRYIDLKVGNGELAQSRKFYTVHYTGWTTDGKKFDSSFDHEGKEPIVFPVGARRVIAGWDTGFEGMRVGGKRRIIVPYQLAYGVDGRPPIIPAKADLIFDVELLAQSDTPPQPPAPPAAPAQPRPATPPPAATGAAPAPQKPATPAAPQPGTNPATEPAAKPQTQPQ